MRGLPLTGDIVDLLRDEAKSEALKGELELKLVRIQTIMKGKATGLQKNRYNEKQPYEDQYESPNIYNSVKASKLPPKAPKLSLAMEERASPLMLGTIKYKRDTVTFENSPFYIKNKKAKDIALVIPDN